MKRILYITSLLLLCLHPRVMAQGSGENYDPKDPADPKMYVSLMVFVGEAGGSELFPYGENMYAAGSKVKLALEDLNSEYSLVGVVHNGDTISKMLPFYYTIPDHNDTLIAYFNPQKTKYPLTVIAEPYAGGSVNPKGTNNYEPGSNVRLTTTSSASDYKFVGWKRGNEILSTSPFFSYITREKADTVRACYVYDPKDPRDPEPPVDPETTPDDGDYMEFSARAVPYNAGYVTPEGKQYLKPGGELSFTAYSYGGFRFKNWVLDGNVYSTESTVKFVMPDHNPEFTAVFEYDPDDPDDPVSKNYGNKATFTPYPFAGGTMSMNSISLFEGNQATVTAKANPDYEFLGWGGTDVNDNDNDDYYDDDNDNVNDNDDHYVNGIPDSTAFISTDSVLTITMGQHNLAYTAYFKYVPKDDVVVHDDMGDANGDGTIDSQDVDMVVRKALGENPAGYVNDNVSFSCDGRTTVIDIVGTIEASTGKFLTDDYYFIKDADPAPETLTEKELLEETGIAFTKKFKAADHTNLKDLFNVMKDYDATVLDKEAEARFNALKEALGTDSIGVDRWGYISYFTNYRRILSAAAFTGHFKVEGNAWNYTEDADDLRAEFTDADGNPVVATVKTSGDTKRIHVGTQELYRRYLSNGYEYDAIDNFVDLPEHISVTLTRGDSTIVDVNVDFDLSQITSSHLSATKDGFGCVVTAKLNNVEVDVLRCAYTAMKGAEVAVRMKMDGKTLFTTGINTNGYVDIKDGDRGISEDEAFSNLKDGNLWLNILGWVQLKGNVADIQQIYKLSKDLHEFRKDGERYSSRVNDINNLVDAKLYYRQEPKVYGRVTLSPDCETDWRGDEEWILHTDITFVSDQSSYAIDTYFNEDSFSTLIDTFNDLLDDFQSTFGEDEEEIPVFRPYK